MRKWVAIGSTLILGVLFIFASGEIPRRITPAGTDMETNTPGLKALGTIITVIPASGPTIGGTTVTIKGTSLGDGTDITAVTINGAPAAITNQSETRVVVTSGVATAGRGDVIVTSTSRGVSTVVGAYRYYEPPVVTTAAVTNVTETTAASGGTVTTTGYATVTARGVCWSTNPNPTTVDTKTEDGTGAGTFTSTITGLSPGQAYYLRAYAVNAAGTAYGDQLTFTTNAARPSISGTVSDGINFIGGATVTFSFNGHTEIIDPWGNFSYTVPNGTTTTVTPSHENYGYWTPSDITFTNITSNEEVSFAGAPITPVIAGQIFFNSRPLSSVELTFSNGGGTVTTNKEGVYSMPVTYGWSGTVTPEKNGFMFWYPQQTYAYVTGNQYNQLYFAFATGPVISGRITTEFLTGGKPDINLVFSNGAGTTETDLYGFYQHVVPFDWSGTVTPELERYTFLPASYTYNWVRSNHDFRDYLATANQRPLITGTITDSGGNSISRVTMALDDTGDADSGLSEEPPDTTLSNGDGDYEGAGDSSLSRIGEGDMPPWSGEIEFEKDLFSFSQSSVTYSGVTDEFIHLELVGTAQTPGISGTVTDLSGNPVPEVRVSFSNNGGMGITDGNGRYFQALPAAWKGVATPLKQNCVFTPASRLYDTFTVDVTDQDYSTATSTDPPGTISVISPESGSTWETGTEMEITWSTTGSVGGIVSELVKGGTTLMVIAPPTANDGTVTWFLVHSLFSGDDYQIRLSDPSNPEITTESGTFTIAAASSVMEVNRDTLQFVSTGTSTTGTQQFRIINTGGGTLNWNVTVPASAPWLTVSPSSGTGTTRVDAGVNPAGLGTGTYTEDLIVRDTASANDTHTVTVTLEVKTAANDAPPLGSIDIPLDGITVNGTVPVAGWALDDIEVAHVKIYLQDTDTGELIYIADPLFIEGARPDIEAQYPSYPFNYNAGWGYMLLTASLPGGGNGTYTIVAIATGGNGAETALGTKTITCDNANSTTPFGNIDTPGPGERVSGSAYGNNGWALTPMPNQIPADGSTIGVYVDGMLLGNPSYSYYRSDVAQLFPGYENSGGAGGQYILDTQRFQNGLHIIHWVALDDAGNQDILGIRYFFIDNGPPGVTSPKSKSQGAATMGKLSEIPIDRSQPVSVITGYGKKQPVQWPKPAENGIITVELQKMQRLEIRLTPGIKYVTPYLWAGGNVRPLPAGSTFDSDKGIFYWQPGPGFLGTYRLEFIGKDERNRVIRKSILIKINHTTHGKK